jgi:hypothetical protein
MNTQLNVYVVFQNQNTVFLVFQTKNKVHDLPCPKIIVLDKQQMKRTRRQRNALLSVIILFV